MADPSGLLEPGNIDLHARPRVVNPDGSISTVRSVSMNFGDGEVLVPTVSDDGRIMTEDEAAQQYIVSGRHLGKFDTPDNATAYAQQLHGDQEREYVGTEGSMAESDDTPKGKLDAARAMLEKSGKPRTAENLNRASLAISQGKATTEFDDKLEAMANPKPRSAPKRTPASTGKDVATEDAKTTAAHMSRPPETAKAGDKPRTPDRPAVPYNTEPTVNTLGEPTMPMPAPRDRSMRGNPQVASNVQDGLPGTGLDLLGEGTAPPVVAAPAGPTKVRPADPYAPSAEELAAEGGPQTLSLEERPPGGAQAATPPAGGFLPQPGAAPPSANQGSFSEYLTQQGILLPNGNLNMNSPAARDGMPAAMGDAGLRAPRFPLARPPGFNGGPPTPSLPPGSVNPPQAALPPPQAALPSSFGPPVPRGLGNPNMATPPPSIPMQGGPTQAHLMPKPAMGRVRAGSERQQNNIIDNTSALVRALRERGPGARP